MKRFSFRMSFLAPAFKPLAWFCLLAFCVVFPACISMGKPYLPSPDLLAAPNTLPEQNKAPSKTSFPPPAPATPVFLSDTGLRFAASRPDSKTPVQCRLVRIPPSISYPTPFLPRSPPRSAFF
jgi:hypothetical protein